MLHTFALRPLFLLPTLLALFTTGCGYDIHDRELLISVDYDGEHFESLASFPDFDAGIEGGDSSCRMMSGDCGHDAGESATMSGDPRVTSAYLSAFDVDFQRYIVRIKRSPTDPYRGSAYIGPSDRAEYIDIYVYRSEIDAPHSCSTQVPCVVNFREL